MYLVRSGLEQGDRGLKSALHILDGLLAEIENELCKRSKIGFAYSKNIIFS